MEYLIANWKSNQNLTESIIWLDSLKALNPKFPPDLKVVVCLPFTEIALFNQKAHELGLPITSAAQDVSHLPPGKHTGEITSTMLSELVSFCLIGHSERRRDFGETCDIVAQKALNLQESSITPIICLDTSYLDEQIKALFQKNVDVSGCFFVYEPLSSIGSGHPELPEEASRHANQISFLTDHRSPVLYGGSVSSDNVQSYVTKQSISGVLVGTDSLEASLFASIINTFSIR